MEKLPPKPKKLKGATREELLNLDKNDLVEKIIQMEAHNTQLKNIINKSLINDSVPKKNVKNRPFDFNKCHTRRVLLHILYFGWDYQGLAVQEDSTQTVEHHMFYALKKACLIESRETAEYHRCGRTDKGVSSFGQVISITLRSNGSNVDVNNELPYCKMLNRLLPKEIRAVAWMPIPQDLTDYSARFDCKKRQYKYYFPRAALDLPAMRRACSHLIGSHDFRHLCKMDVGNGVVEFIRNIVTADIVAVDKAEPSGDEPTSMYYLLIEGNAFLWHQIRCMMGVLLLIGQKQESPDVIKELLDVDKNPRKPQYNMALDVPLNLYHCSFDLEKTQSWFFDREELKVVIAHLQGEWTSYNVKATMIKDCLQSLEDEYAKIQQKGTENTESNEIESDSVMSYTDCLLQGVKPKVYTPLLKRETCSSLEERIEYYRKKRKVDDNSETMETS